MFVGKYLHLFTIHVVVLGELLNSKIILTMHGGWTQPMDD